MSCYAQFGNNFPSLNSIDEERLVADKRPADKKCEKKNNNGYTWRAMWEHLCIIISGRQEQG